MTMDCSPSSPQDLQVRLFVACPHSGSTLLMSVFAESPCCAVTSRVILNGNAGSSADNFTPDYSILEDLTTHYVFIQAMNSGKRFIICEEELKGECKNFPAPSAYAMTQPVFLIRDPVRVFDSWKNVGWTDSQSLINCFTNMLRMLHQAPSETISSLLYERLIWQPHTEIERICRWWGVPFSANMLQASSSVRNDVPYHNLLSNVEKDNIELHIGRRYLECWHEGILRLRAMLAEKTWFGFDLDDTLHEFLRSSGVAAKEVLEKISMRYNTSLTALQEEYSSVLKEKAANAFSDGKTSHDYRRERFASVLAKFSLPQDSTFLAELLDSYESTLKASLELKSGALAILSTIRSMGKKIVVITEGPQDAQERTVKDLGIDGYIDFLATTNHFHMTKLDGLFPRVLGYLGISPSDIAYVGDNEQRDMKPAMAEGILCIHLSEAEDISLDAFPPRINTLQKLQYILSSERNDLE